MLHQTAHKTVVHSLGCRMLLKGFQKFLILHKQLLQKGIQIPILHGTDHSRQLCVHIIRAVLTYRKVICRRLVASPKPVEIVEQDAINSLVDANKIVICCGGGGIPVTLEGHHLKGASAVIDKDFASCLLAKQLDADMLIILTAVEKVAVN